MDGLLGLCGLAGASTIGRKMVRGVLASEGCRVVVMTSEFAWWSVVFGRSGSSSGVGVFAVMVKLTKGWSLMKWFLAVGSTNDF